MKTKLWIFGFVMVLATFTAFESYSAQFVLRYRIFPANPFSCTAVVVGCDLVPIFQCWVYTPVGVRFVWQNSVCTIPAFHSTSDILTPQ